MTYSWPTVVLAICQKLSGLRGSNPFSPAERWAIPTAILCPLLPFCPSTSNGDGGCFGRHSLLVCSRPRSENGRHSWPHHARHFSALCGWLLYWGLLRNMWCVSCPNGHKRCCAVVSRQQLIANGFFRLGNQLLTLAWAIAFPSLACCLGEELVDVKVLLAVTLAYFVTSHLGPHIGVALWPIPGVTGLRSRLHLTETTGCPENQGFFHKLKALLVLLIQSFVAIAVFVFRTLRFVLK